MFDILIVGGGCAGLTAALYGARAGKRVAVFESGNIGGQIAKAHLIKNYPGINAVTGMEFANNLYGQAISYGVDVKFEEVQKVNDFGNRKEIITDEGVYEAQAVIIATGVKHRPLGLKNETELTGHGVSYCAVCDGAFYKGNDVAVVGGGNTAVTDAIFLSEYCHKVYVIHRRDSFKAERYLVEKASEKYNIEFLMNTEVTYLHGRQNLEGVTVRNKETGEKKELFVRGLFAAVGQIPENQIFEELGILDGDGYVEAGETGETSLPGIYAAGDCRSKKVRQLATAVSDGVNAVMSAMEKNEM